MSHKPIDTITDMKNENKELKDKLLSYRVISAILFILLILTIASHIGLDNRYEEDTNDLARKINSLYTELEECQNDCR